MRGALADPTEDQQEFKIGTQHLSKSGEGMTAELDWDLDGNHDEDDDEFMIPQVRIHPEPRSMKKTASTDSVEEDESASPTRTVFKAPAYLLTPEQMHQIFSLAC